MKPKPKSKSVKAWCAAYKGKIYKFDSIGMIFCFDTLEGLIETCKINVGFNRYQNPSEKYLKKMGFNFHEVEIREVKK